MEQFKGFYVEENSKTPYDIVFSLQDSSQEIPPKYQLLYSEVERTKANIIKIFESNPQNLEKYFKMLLSLAQAGLAGENSTPQISLIALENLKNDILVIEGFKFKNAYIIKLGENAFINIFISYLVFLVFNILEIPNFNKYFFIFGGSMIGSWISFGIRKLEITFEDLVNFEKDLMTYQVRLIFVGIISIIFGMIIDNELITFSIGNIGLNTLLLKTETTLLFGILCGILDKNLAINLYQKSHDILNISQKGR